jgi:hypothetical protein
MQIMHAYADPESKGQRPKCKDGWRFPFLFFGWGAIGAAQHKRLRCLSLRIFPSIASASLWEVMEMGGNSRIQVLADDHMVLNTCIDDMFRYIFDFAEGRNFGRLCLRRGASCIAQVASNRPPEWGLSRAGASIFSLSTQTIKRALF